MVQNASRVGTTETSKRSASGLPRKGAARPPRITSVKVEGYRPFRSFFASFRPLEVLVGANGSGKSSLFEFLKFIRDSIYQDIPPEIVAGSVGQQIFHIPGPERFWWSIEVDFSQANPIRYQGELMGPVGRTHIAFERVQTKSRGHLTPYLFMNIRERKGLIQDPESKRLTKQKIALKRPNQLALSTITNPAMVTLYNLREYIRNWRFYLDYAHNQRFERGSTRLMLAVVE